MERKEKKIILKDILIVCMYNTYVGSLKVLREATEEEEGSLLMAMQNLALLTICLCI